MNDMLLTILSLSAFGSGLAGILFLLKPVTKNRVGKAFSYYLWIVVLLRLCLPFGASLIVPAGWFGETGAASGAGQAVGYDPWAQTSGQTAIAQLGTAAANPSGSAEGSADAGTPSEDDQSSGILQATAAWLKHPGVWLTVWAAGALLCMAWYLFGYIRFTGIIRRTGADPDQADLAVFHEFPESGRVRLVRSEFVRTPMLVGTLRPAVVLPAAAYARNGMADHLRDILNHELTHYRRRDMLYKWFAMAVTSLHWFNPLMHLVRREINRACELSCDEAVIRSLSPKQKQHYGETLLSLAVDQRLPMGILATTMCEEKTQLKERLVSIMRYKTKRWTAVLLSLVLLLGLVGCAIVDDIGKADETEPMSAQEAMDALENSLIFSEDGTGARNLTFAIPNCEQASGFQIRISGHEASGAEVSYYGEKNGKWKAQESVSFHPEDWSAFTDLLFTASLDGAQPLEADLLALYRHTYDVTLFEKYGLKIAIPNEYIDRLLVFQDDTTGTVLISVFEKRSYEESKADFGEDGYAGYLFSIVRYTQAQYEQYLSSDGSGLSFFAKDDTYYYGWSTPTDVQYYRSGGAIDTESDDWNAWSQLVEQCRDIKKDFTARNHLTAYSDSEFWNKEFTYDSQHLYLTYYPYYAYQSTAAQQGFGWQDVAYTLVLSQPAAQGEKGIWCVERWYDTNYGTLYYEFPDQAGQCAADYYAAQQSTVNAGGDGFRLDPEQVALEFVKDHFDHTLATEASFRRIEGEPAGNVLSLCSQVFDDMGTLQAATLAASGERTDREALEAPESLKPFDSYARSSLYAYIWLKAEKPASLSGNVVYCRNADRTKTLGFYQQDSLLCVNVDGTEQWFKPAYANEKTPYDRMLGYYEEFLQSYNPEPAHSYSDAEIDQATDAVYDFIFPGCTLTKLTYDPVTSYKAAQGYLQNGRGSVNGATIDNVIVLYGSFTTDGNQQVLNPNSTYDNYMFILIRENAGSAWVVDDCGY